MQRTHLPILLLLATAAAHGQSRSEGSSPDPTDLAALYAGRCASCHVPPDPAFAVDRAWITQLADTA